VTFALFAVRPRVLCGWAPVIERVREAVAFDRAALLSF
jgi:hypothetical protein